MKLPRPKVTRRDRRQQLLLMLGEAVSLYALENGKKPAQTADSPDPVKYQSVRQVIEMTRRTA